MLPETLGTLDYLQKSLVVELEEMPDVLGHPVLTNVQLVSRKWN